MSPGVRAARDSVLRVTGTACGLGDRGLGLGRGAESRRHERPRRRRDDRTPASTGATATSATRPWSPSTRATTSPCCASTGSGAPPLAIRRPGRGRGGRDSRLPRERPVHGHAGADRPDRRRCSPTTPTGAGRSGGRSRRCAGSSERATPAGRRSTAQGVCGRRSSPPASARPRGTASRRRSSANRSPTRADGRVSTGPCVR